MSMLHFYIFPKFHYERIKHIEKLKEFYSEYPNIYCLDDSIINTLVKFLDHISIQ